MKIEHFMVSTLDFFRVFFMKNFFPKFELLNSGFVYLRVFTVLFHVFVHMIQENSLIDKYKATL